MQLLAYAASSRYDVAPGVTAGCCSAVAIRAGSPKLGLRGSRRNATRVVVVDVGAFGGWTALKLAERGAAVTLVDAWGAGSVRASSGGETRVTRGVYNGQRVYIDMVRGALDLWREHEAAWERTVYRQTARSGFQTESDASRGVADARCAPTLEELTLADAVRRFPRFASNRSVCWGETTKPRREWRTERVLSETKADDASSSPAGEPRPSRLLVPR